jgi:hypothetical protein
MPLAHYPQHPDSFGCHAIENDMLLDDVPAKVDMEIVPTLADLGVQRDRLKRGGYRLAIDALLTISPGFLRVLEDLSEIILRHRAKANPTA